MGGSSKNQNVTQTTEPPDYLRPYLWGAASESQRLYDTMPVQQYQGPTVVGFSPETEQALSGTAQRATNGSPVNQAASGFAQNVLGNAPSTGYGSASNPWANAQNNYANAQNPYATAQADYASAQNPYANASNPYGSGSNPYLDATFNKAADSVQNRLSSQFAGSGRNVEASRAAQADELNNLATNIYGGDYQNERNRQLQYQSQLTGIGAQGYENAQSRDLQYRGQLAGIGAQGFENAQNRDLQYRGQLTGIGSQGYELERDRAMNDIAQQRQQQMGVLGMAPGIANQDYVDLERLAGVGAAREDLTGREYEDAASRFDFAQNLPGLNLDQYITRLQGMPGSSVSTSSPIYRNTGAGILGGASAGQQIGNQFGYGGWGALLGGLLGGYG